MRQNTLKEPGCVFMHFLQPQDDSDTWVMLEMFRSRAAWDEHMASPTTPRATGFSKICCVNRRTFACSTRSNSVDASACCRVQHRLQSRFRAVLGESLAIVLEARDEVGVLGDTARQKRLDPKRFSRIARYQ